MPEPFEAPLEARGKQCELEVRPPKGDRLSSGAKAHFSCSATWGLKSPPPKEAIQRQDAAFGMGAL